MEDHFKGHRFEIKQNVFFSVYFRSPVMSETTLDALSQTLTIRKLGHETLIITYDP